VKRIDFDQVRAESFGKWPSIYHHFGVDVGTGRHKPCPVCGGKDRFRFDDKRGFGEYFCGGCGAGDGFGLLTKVMGIEYKEVMSEVSRVIGKFPECEHPKEKPVSKDLMRQIFRESQPVKQGDVVHRYLKNRGLSSMPRALRASTMCWESETKKPRCAMIGTFHDVDGKAITVQRVYLTKDGRKLDIKSPKKILPTIKPMNGGACRLYTVPDGVLGIAEGIGTAIACKELFNIPVWASLSATLMEQFEPPAGITKVRVFADNDANYAGQKAAYSLANRLIVVKKIDAEVFVPVACGDDFLDQLIKDKGE